MANITVLNMQSLKNKAINAINYGLLAVFLLGSSFVAPRLANHVGFNNGYDRAVELVRFGNLEQRKRAIQKLDELEKVEYLWNPDFAGARTYVYSQLEGTAILEIENAIKEKRFVLARQKFEQYKKEVFANSKQFPALEKMMEGSAPANLERADESKLPGEKLGFYDSTAVALIDLGKTVPAGLEQKIVDSSVEVALDNLEHKRKDAIERTLDNVQYHLTNKKSAKLSKEIIIKILNTDVNYLNEEVIPSKDGILKVEKNIASIESIVSAAKVKDKEEIVRSFIGSIVDGIKIRSSLMKSTEKEDLDYIDFASKLNDKYSLGKHNDILTSYLGFARKDSKNKALIKKALTSAVLLTESQNYVGKEDARATIAERFLSEAKPLSPEERIVYYEIARQLYQKAGVKYSAAIVGVEGMISQDITEIWAEKDKNKLDLRINNPQASPDQRPGNYKSQPQKAGEAK